MNFTGQVRGQSPASMIYDECSRFLPRGPYASTQELILHCHCLVGYTKPRETLFFFPSFVHSTLPPTFLLSHLYFPKLPLFRQPLSSSCRYTHCLYLSLSFRHLLRSTGCITTFACRFIGSVNFLSIQLSNRRVLFEGCESFSVLFRFWTLSLTLLHKSE